MAEPKKKKKKKKVEIVLTPAEKFQQYVTLMNATRCILKVEDEYKIYLRLVNDFAKLAEEAAEEPFEGIEQCMDLSAQCAEKAKELEPQLPKEKEEESQTVTTTAKEREERDKANGKEKKISKGKIGFACVCLLIIAFVVCYNVNATRYVIAGLQNSIGLQEMAMSSYEKLGQYKDSSEKVKEVRFAIEKKSIEEAKKGSIVCFGSKEKDLNADDNKWMVLKKDKETGVAILAKAVGINEVKYHEKEEEVTWETSDLRKYLNGDYITESFNDVEVKALVENELTTADNPIYQIKGGNVTKDKVYIPDVKEYDDYKELLKDKANCMRLRTPGNNLKTTAFASYRKEIMQYGMLVNEAGSSIRPFIQVKYK